jgi:hypothetical protein
VGRFVEQLVRDRLLNEELDGAYQAMAAEEQREAEAIDWAVATLEDVDDEAWWGVGGALRSGDQRRERATASRRRRQQ